MEETQRNYELIFILSPQLGEGDLDKTRNEISETINQLGGTISFKETEKRNLAYPINKQGQGIFLISQVKISPENISNLSKQLKINKQILRHVINQLEAAKPENEKAKSIKKPVIHKKKLFAEKEKPSTTKAATGNLEEIDKKLNEIIGEV